jgi:hypothetical protein
MRTHRHLKPGYGWMEHVEIGFYPSGDDGSLLPNSALVQWANYLADATERAYRSLAYNRHTRQMLETFGFVDISEQVIKVALNSWGSDPHSSEMGRWYNLGFVRGVEALSLAPFVRMFHWKFENVDRIVAAAKRDICMKKNHAYCNM